ncbi:hypothetical protein HN51_001549 [Arachis hypogaea]|uniref:Aminotransferase class V domain-containing protein n=2 Tax=Arachis TaxID=3817 RepID=A0A445ER59_ARAHY|nr:molybdenum cofactor sulfurase-like isoform X1 [Arachis duranensis]XP_025703204.1 molybdenum cofactor sulfurase [Arachis hypogaea]QHO49671.1 Molybdenum cofactor sulfurase [Arachis hypogaea]RYR77887.1 hypothetical protein Ahy_A01g002574 [Arachis hypogaea]
MNPSSNSKPCFNGCFPSPLSLVSAESSDTPKPRFSNVALSNQEFAESIYSTLHPHTYFTNHETLPTLQDSYSNFIKAFPKFPNTFKIDEIRSQEYHHLTFSNTCFDYTGNGLFSYAQQQRSLLSTTSLAAASSSSSTFATTEPLSFFDVSYKSVTLPSQILYGGHDTELELRMSERIMRFMNVSESEYTLVFTANEVSAFKILANSFQFHPNGELLTVYDHSSEALETMIQVCKNQAVTPLSAEFSWPSLKMNWRKLKKKIIANKIIKNNNGNNNNKGLFVFPLRSRVTGTPHSYVWMSMAQEKGWRVLLDACSMRPKETSSLGLSMFKPDFMICSFYKVFGENPSGFGCLFVKKSSICSLKDSCNDSALGIVSLVPAFKKQNLSFIAAADVDDEENEPKPKDQCSNSNSVPKLDSFNSGKRFGHMIDTFGSECRGLDHADSVGLMLINCRARCLINWLVNALLSLQHPNPENGISMVRIYGPNVSSHRGPAVAFNIFDWKGEKIDPKLVQKLADRNNISLGSAFLRNMKLDKNQEEEQRALESSTSDDYRPGLYKKRDSHGLGLGPGIFVVTSTLGFLTNFEDVYRLWAFISRFLDADFVEKETWRYVALNQKTIDI